MISAFFHRKSANFAISRNTDTNFNLIQVIYIITLFEYLKIALTKMVTSQQKWILQAFLKKVFENTKTIL